METDADRRNMLLALGGSSAICIRDIEVVGLFDANPQREQFDDVSVSVSRPTLQCLWSDVNTWQFKDGDNVSIPDDETAYYIADIQNDNGLALIELRKE